MEQDVEALAATIRSKLEEAPAEVAFEEALKAAADEILHKAPARLIDVEPVEVIKQEIHEEAESIRPFLEKVDRRQKLEKLASEVSDRFADSPAYQDSDLPQEQERIESTIEQLRNSTPPRRSSANPTDVVTSL